MKRSRQHEPPERIPKNTRPCGRCEFKFDSSKLLCPSCNHWNIVSIAALSPEETGREYDETILASAMKDRPRKGVHRIETGPWDGNFGKNYATGKVGVATKSVYLLGGAPGAGKSTVSIQLSESIAAVTKREVLYICIEEDEDQVYERMERLGCIHMNKLRIYPMGASYDIGEIIAKRIPSAVILDSISGMTKDTELQIDICKTFKKYSVQYEFPTIVIAHINKKSEIAGAMGLQHEVDATLALFPVDGGKSDVRELWTEKSRVGPAQFSTHYLMTDHGLIAHNYTEDENEDEEEDDDDDDDK